MLGAVPLQIAHAAEFEIVYKSCPDDDPDKLSKLPEPQTNCKASADKIRRGHIVLRLSGDIAPGDADRLEKLLAGQIEDVATFGYANGGGSFVTVDMAGEGGSVEGAIELGSFFNDNAVAARIVRDAACAGPCALAFMGGRARWGRLTRPAVERRLEAGGRLIFRSPLYPQADAAAEPDKLRELARSVQSYAAHVEVVPLVLAKILGLKRDESFAIDNVFWAKVADITVDGILPLIEINDDDYISACLSQVDWTYGLDGENGEPPKLKDDQGNWIEGEVVYRSKAYLIVAVVWSFSRYDYWCALNATRAKTVTVPRRKVRAILRKWTGRNTLLDRDSDEDIELKGNEIYFSKAPTILGPTRAQNSLDLLLHAPETKLAAIADPKFKWNPWSNWDPWFEHDGP